MVKVLKSALQKFFTWLFFLALPSPVKQPNGTPLNRCCAMPSTLFTIVLLLLLATVVVVVQSGKSTVNPQVKRKRDAKAKAKKMFLSKHGMVFDSYGRVLRWGKDPTKYECKENKKIGLYCTVTDSSTRKYRTKEEERRGKMIKLDKQAELDGQFGSGSDDAKKARRRRKENRRRCSLYNEWLENFEKDKSEKHKGFYNWLNGQFADFQTLRRLSPGRRGLKKARKLYRNIAREIHSDKLPEDCRKDNMKSMMSTILGKVESVRDCIAEPHTCAEGEL